MSKATDILRFIPYSDDGRSDWARMDFLETQTGYQLTGNGNPMFQDDRGLGEWFQIEKRYSGGQGNKVIAARFRGWKNTKRPFMPRDREKYNGD